MGQYIHRFRKLHFANFGQVKTFDILPNNFAGEEQLIHDYNNLL